MLKGKYKNLVVIDSATKGDSLNKLIADGKFKSVLRQVGGDKGWVARIRFHKDKPVIHFMNTALIGVPHPTIKDNAGVYILKDIKSKVENNDLKFEINSDKVELADLAVLSPELGTDKRPVDIQRGRRGYSTLSVNLNNIDVYAVAQG